VKPQRALPTFERIECAAAIVLPWLLCGLAYLLFLALEFT
jgi:hypothetical protein